MLKQLVKRRQKPGVYLIDFSVFAIPKELRTTRNELIACFQAAAGYDEGAIAQMHKILFGPDCGLGDATGVPSGMKKTPCVDLSLTAALEEMEMIIYKVAEDALNAAHVKPADVDVIITAGSSLAPVPSVSAMIAHRFKMRSDVQSYSLAGQGCAYGIIAIELAAQLLRASGGKTALLVLHDNCTAGISLSHDKATFTSNLIFRLNGAALVLSSRPKDKRRAKYELLRMERTLLTGDEAFDCIKVREDTEGVRGVYLYKHAIVSSAGKAIKAILIRLAPSVLPLSELVRLARNKERTPDWSKAFEHILIHTGAATVISAVVNGMKISPKAALPSSETLQRFGNTGLCSTYYILANIETQGGMKKGDRILQLSFGSGFKCGAGYWRALRNVNDAHHPAWDPYEALSPQPNGCLNQNGHS